MKRCHDGNGPPALLASELPEILVPFPRAIPSDRRGNEKTEKKKRIRITPDECLGSA
jgi:hypothetical protein